MRHDTVPSSKYSHLFSITYCFWILITLPFIASGCHKNRANTLSEVRIQAISDPISLSPHRAEDGNSLRIVHLLMEGLVTYSAHGDLVNAGADSVISTNNFKIHRVTISGTHRWSDGSRVVADDYVRGWRYALTPDVVSPLSDFLFVIKGASDFKKGKLQDFQQVGVKAIDPSTIQFETTEPCVYFSHILAMAVAMARHENEGENNQVSFVTGLYQIEKWQANESIKLKENSFHRAAHTSKPLPEQIKFLIVSEEVTALNMWKSGQLHVATRIPHIEMKSLISSGVVHSYPFRATYYIGFQHQHKPWNSLAARKAFMSSINTKEVEQVLGIDANAATDWIQLDGKISSESLTANSNNSTHDAGFFKNTKIELAYDAGGRNQTIVENIQQQLKRELKLDIKLKPRDWKTHLQGLNTKDTALFRFGWLSPFLDPVAHLMVFKSDGANNYTGWKNKEYDEIILRLGYTADKKSRQKLVDKAVWILKNEAVIVPIYHYKISIVKAPQIGTDVADLALNPLGHFKFL